MSKFICRYLMEDVYRDFEKHLEIYFRLVSMASFIVLKAGDGI
jgi:hypothetical protein